MKRRRQDPQRMAQAIPLKRAEVQQFQQAHVAEFVNRLTLADWHRRNAYNCRALGNEILYR